MTHRARRAWRDADGRGLCTEWRLRAIGLHAETLFNNFSSCLYYDSEDKFLQDSAIVRHSYNVQRVPDSDYRFGDSQTTPYSLSTVARPGRPKSGRGGATTAAGLVGQCADWATTDSDHTAGIPGAAIRVASRRVAADRRKR